MMNCICCDNSLDTKFHYQICSVCRTNPDIMISSKDIREKFKLNAKDLYKANLFCINTKYETRYFFLDIVELSEQITKDLSNRSSMKLAYLKQKEIADNFINNKEMLIKRKTNIIQLVIKLAPKYDINMNDKLIVVLKKLIDEYIQTASELPDMLFATDICDELSVYDKVCKRKVLIDNLIRKKYGEQYINVVNTNVNYNKYIRENSISLEEAFGSIKDTFEHTKHN